MIVSISGVSVMRSIGLLGRLHGRGPNINRKMTLKQTIAVSFKFVNGCYKRINQKMSFVRRQIVNKRHVLKLEHLVLSCKVYNY